MATKDEISAADMPHHYTGDEFECIDVIRAVLGDDFAAYCRGNVIKYAFRAGKKGDTFAEDMKKAANFALWAARVEWRYKMTKGE